MLFCGFNFHAVSRTQTSGVFLINGRQEDVAITFTLSVIMPEYIREDISSSPWNCISLSKLPSLNMLIQRGLYLHCIFVLLIYWNKFWSSLQILVKSLRSLYNSWSTLSYRANKTDLAIVKSYNGIKTWKIALLITTPWIHY